MHCLTNISPICIAFLFSQLHSHNMKPNMVPWLLSTPLLLLPPLLLITKLEAKVPAIIVFGDSTVDAGNNNQVPTLVRSDFAPYGRDFEGGKPTGRFSNGRLVTDFVSEAFGLKPFVPAYLDPAYSIEDFATGVTFASAGTGYDNVTAQLTNVIPLWKQLENFKEYKSRLSSHFGTTKAEQILQEALYVTSMGTNDIVLNYYLVPERSIQFTIEAYENFLVSIAENFVVELYKLGARKISLGGLPPIGCLPLMRTLFFKSNKGDCREEFNNLARNFDGKLSALVRKLRKEVKDMKLVFSNTLDKSLEILKSPRLYGLENVGEGCCGTGTFEFGFACHDPNKFTCTNASTYAFWDAAHPTEVLYRIVADHLMKTSLAEFHMN